MSRGLGDVYKRQLFLSLAQIRERRPLRNRGTAEDFYFCIFLNLFEVSDSLLLYIPAALRNSFVWWLRTAPADLIIDNI